MCHFYCCWWSNSLFSAQRINRSLRNPAALGKKIQMQCERKLLETDVAILIHLAAVLWEHLSSSSNWAGTRPHPEGFCSPSPGLALKCLLEKRRLGVNALGSRILATAFSQSSFSQHQVWRQGSHPCQLQCLDEEGSRPRTEMRQL